MAVVWKGKDVLINIIDEIMEFTDRYIVHGDAARQLGLKKKQILSIERHIQKQRKRTEHSIQK